MAARICDRFALPSASCKSVAATAGIVPRAGIPLYREPDTWAKKPLACWIIWDAARLAAPDAVICSGIVHFLLSNNSKV
jgi:hypothetical protein